MSVRNVDLRRLFSYFLFWRLLVYLLNWFCSLLLFIGVLLWFLILLLLLMIRILTCLIIIDLHALELLTHMRSWWLYFHFRWGSSKRAKLGWRIRRPICVILQFWRPSLQLPHRIIYDFVDQILNFKNIFIVKTVSHLANAILRTEFFLVRHCKLRMHLFFKRRVFLLGIWFFIKNSFLGNLVDKWSKLADCLILLFGNWVPLVVVNQPLQFIYGLVLIEMFLEVFSDDPYLLI